MTTYRFFRRQNAKFKVGDKVAYGPYEWTITKITPEGKYFLKQIGGSGQVAEHVVERELRAL